MSGWGSIYNNTSYALWMHSKEMARLHEMGSSGARVNRASDDPIDAYRIMRLRSNTTSTDVYLKNLEDVARTLETGHGFLQKVSDTIVRSEQLLTQAASGTYVGPNKTAIAEELDSLLEQTVMLMNSQSLGNFVFGGEKTSSEPFKVRRENGTIVGVEYVGSDRDLRVPVADGVLYSGMLVGSDIVDSNNRQAPSFHGNTGAKAGTRTSSIRGSAWLEVAHSNTTFEAGSQISTGSSSSLEDTLLGGHTITISAANKTIALDNGVPVSFVGNETNLQLVDGNNRVIHVDMTGWSDADGEFELISNARLSIDGGHTWTNADFNDENLPVVHGDTGKVLYVDARSIETVGVNAVGVAGTRNVFDVLIQARDLLDNHEDLPDAMVGELLHEAVDAMKESQNSVTRTMTAVGGRLQAMDNLRLSLEDNRDATKQQADTLEQADIMQVAIDLARVQNLYEMTLATASKLLNLSLMDFL